MSKSRRCSRVRKFNGSDRALESSEDAFNSLLRSLFLSINILITFFEQLLPDTSNSWECEGYSKNRRLCATWWGLIYWILSLPSKNFISVLRSVWMRKYAVLCTQEYVLHLFWAAQCYFEREVSQSGFELHRSSS